MLCCYSVAAGCSLAVMQVIHSPVTSHRMRATWYIQWATASETCHSLCITFLICVPDAHAAPISTYCEGKVLGRGLF